MKYNEFSLGQVEAVFNKLGGSEGVGQFLRGELVLSKAERRWREKDGVIYFSVTSDGTTGKGWVRRLNGRGVAVGVYAKRVLCSSDFKPTSGITTEIAVLKSVLFDYDNKLTNNKVRLLAAKRNLATPNTEIACLIRDLFTQEEVRAMGLWWIVTMHEPIRDFDGNMCLFGGHPATHSSYFDLYCCDGPDASWNDNCGFAFAVSQTPSV